MATLKVHDRTFSFEIIRRSRKTVEIQIDSVSGFRVIAPKRLSEKALLTLLEPKKQWIYEKLLEIERLQKSKVYHSYEEGDVFQVLGQPCRLHLDIDSSRRRKTASLSEGVLTIRVSENNREIIRDAVVHFYRQLTRSEVEKKIEPLAQALGVSYNRIAIKDQKRRWGSCSQLGNLNFNWRCGMMPEFVFDYILIHELCHLVHLNHSPAYWELVRSLCPNEAAARRWLKHHGMSLDI